jgi:hypothetical protein
MSGSRISAIGGRRKPPSAVDRIADERRSDKRYGIYLEADWQLLRRKKTLDSGHGRTVNLSSGGILLKTGRQLPVGLKIHLSIAWPVLLHNTSPLQWSVCGSVVRSDKARAAVQIERHTFCAVEPSAQSDAESVGMPPEPSAPKRSLSKAGKAAIVAAVKKRWALKRENRSHTANE